MPAASPSAASPPASSRATPLDPRTPVLVGAGQILQREEDPRAAGEPLELMQRAAERAAEDARAPGLLSALDSIYVPQGLWAYGDPGATLRDRFGSPGARTALAPISGSTVQWLVGHACREIVAGRRDLVLLVAAEAERSRRRAKARGMDLDWSEGPPDADRGAGAEILGTQLDMGDWERRYRVRPIQAFSMYENALCAHLGEKPDRHREKIASLWADFARVAASNPHAWIRDAPSAREIATVTESNPLVGYPYTKRMVANMVVDLGAALILCSYEAATRHGVPREAMVFPHASVDATRRCGVPVRIAYHDEPVMRLAGRRAMQLAGREPEDFDHVDLYSCFPSAVQIAASELGFDLQRPLTVTGGLTFAGGPFNSYVMHSIATVMDRVRSAPGTCGFVSGVGGYMSKHAFGVYASEPAEAGFRSENLDEAAEALPTRRALDDYRGTARVETFCVLPGGKGDPGRVLLACLTADGERVFGTCDDPDLVATVEDAQLPGRRVRLRSGVARLG